jgi:hypothetical protein
VKLKRNTPDLSTIQHENNSKKSFNVKEIEPKERKMILKVVMPPETYFLCRN